MRAVVWHGRRDVRVDEVPDPTIQHPGDAVIRVTSTNICGSDLHLYEPLGAFMNAGDVLGHEAMGVVEEVGAGVTAISPGDRVVIPFQVCCGTCWMCEHGLQSQCETTQVRDQGKGATLFGYSEALRLPPRRSGRAPPRAAGAVHPHRRAGRATRRALRLPQRRPAHGLAGRRVRGPRAGGEPPRARARADRRHGVPHRAPARRPAGHRRRPRRRAARTGPFARRHDRGPARGRRRRGRGARAAPRGEVPTPSSTPSGWRPTAHPSSRPRTRRSGCCPTRWPSRS